MTHKKRWRAARGRTGALDTAKQCSVQTCCLDWGETRDPWRIMADTYPDVDMSIEELLGLVGATTTDLRVVLDSEEIMGLVGEFVAHGGELVLLGLVAEKWRASRTYRMLLTASRVEYRMLQLEHEARVMRARYRALEMWWVAPDVGLPGYWRWMPSAGPALRRPGPTRTDAWLLEVAARVAVRRGARANAGPYPRVDWTRINMGLGG